MWVCLYFILKIQLEKWCIAQRLDQFEFLFNYILYAISWYQILFVNWWSENSKFGQTAFIIPDLSNQLLISAGIFNDNFTPILAQTIFCLIIHYFHRRNGISTTPSLYVELFQLSNIIMLNIYFVLQVN